MLELQLQTNCRCDICKQHVGITAANQLPLYKWRQRETERERERERQREGERERETDREAETETERQRQKDREIVTAANQLPLLHMTFPYPGHAFKEKRGPAYLENDDSF
jgi:hypothetical protein